MQRQPDLAGLGGRIAGLAAAHMLLEPMQGRFVQLRKVESPITGKSAAEHLFRPDHPCRTPFGQLQQSAFQAHFAGGAGWVNSDGRLFAREFELVHQKLEDELNRFIEFKTLVDGQLHALQTGTGIAQYWYLPVFRRRQQPVGEFRRLPVRFLQKALTLKCLTTAKTVELLRIDDFVATFLEQ